MASPSLGLFSSPSPFAPSTLFADVVEGAGELPSTMVVDGIDKAPCSPLSPLVSFKRTPVHTNAFGSAIGSDPALPRNQSVGGAGVVGGSSTARSGGQQSQSDRSDRSGGSNAREGQSSQASLAQSHDANQSVRLVSTRDLASGDQNAISTHLLNLQARQPRPKNQKATTQSKQLQSSANGTPVGQSSRQNQQHGNKGASARENLNNNNQPTNITNITNAAQPVAQQNVQQTPQQSIQAQQQNFEVAAAAAAAAAAAVQIYGGWGTHLTLVDTQLQALRTLSFYDNSVTLTPNIPTQPFNLQQHQLTQLQEQLRKQQQQIYQQQQQIQQQQLQIEQQQQQQQSTYAAWGTHLTLVDEQLQSLRTLSTLGGSSASRGPMPVLGTNSPWSDSYIPQMPSSSMSPPLGHETPNILGSLSSLGSAGGQAGSGTAVGVGINFNANAATSASSTKSPQLQPVQTPPQPPAQPPSAAGPTTAVGQASPTAVKTPALTADALNNLFLQNINSQHATNAGVASIAIVPSNDTGNQYGGLLTTNLPNSGIQQIGGGRSPPQYVLDVHQLRFGRGLGSMPRVTSELSLSESVGTSGTTEGETSDATTSTRNNGLSSPDHAPSTGAGDIVRGDIIYTPYGPSFPPPPHIHVPQPCGHVRRWRRLRHKKGLSHFICTVCGMKWKSRYGEFMPEDESGETHVSDGLEVSGLSGLGFSLEDNLDQLEDKVGGVVDSGIKCGGEGRLGRV